MARLGLIFAILLLPSASFAESSDGPPSAVARLLADRCVTCHDEVMATEGRLDLSRWVKGPDGLYDFPHQGPDGRQLAQGRTFRSILDRVTSKDADERMPLGDQLSGADIQVLRAWMSSPAKFESP